MISLIKLLERLPDSGTVFNAGETTPMIKLVFWDGTNGLKDQKKVKEILRVLERNLKIVRPTYKISPKEVMDTFQYYSTTDKLIGNYPKYLFFDSDKKYGTYSVNMKNCRFKSELLKVSKTLEVKQKTV